MSTRGLKQALMLVVLVGIATALVGCGNSSKPEPTPTVTASPPEVKIPANLTVAQFNAVVQPQGGILAYGLVTNVGKGKSRRNTEVRLVKLDGKGNAEVLDTASIKPLIPQENATFNFKVAHSKLTVTKELKIRVICNATRSEPETKKGSKDNTSDLTLVYGPDMIVTGVCPETNANSTGPAKEPEDGKKVLLPEVKNIGTIRSGKVTCKWEVSVLDTDTPTCYEQQDEIYGACKEYSAKENNNQWPTLPKYMEPIVQKKYLPEYPLDPGSDSKDSWNNYESQGLTPAAEGDVISCKVHGSRAHPKTEVKKEDVKWAELKSYTISLDPGQSSIKEGRLETSREMVQKALGGVNLAGKSVLFRLTVDPTVQVPELDKQNNVGSARHKYPNPLRLAEIDVWCLVAAWWNQDNYIRLFAGVRNLGNAPTGDFESQWSVGLEPWKNQWNRKETQANRVPLAPTLKHQSIPAMSYEDISKMPWAMWDPKEYAGKTVSLAFDADYNNKVQEWTDFVPPTTNTTDTTAAAAAVNGPNNTMHWNLKLPPERFTPDLAIYGYAYRAPGGRAIRIYAAATNYGTLQSEAFKILITTEGYEKAISVKNLPVKSWYTVPRFDVPVTDAMRSQKFATINFSVVPSRPDKEEKNNKVTWKVKVTQGFDLAVTNVSIDQRRSTDKPADGSGTTAGIEDANEIVVTGTVTNLGDEASDTYTFNVGSESGGFVDGKDECLKPRESRTYTHIHKIVDSSWGKKYEGVMTIKPAGTDLHPDNNTAKSQEIVFLPPKNTDPTPEAKLVIDTLYWHRLGAQICCHANVTNRGNGKSIGTTVQWWTNCQADTKKPAKERFLLGLAPGASADENTWSNIHTLRFRYTPTKNDPTNIQIYCVVDPTNLACPYNAEKCRGVEAPRDATKNDPTLAEPKPYDPEPLLNE